MWPFKDKKFLLVATFVSRGVHKGDSKDVANLYFYLYENDAGDRKMEWKCRIKFKQNANMAGLTEYSEKIYPWIQGKDFDDIPSYWDVLNERREGAVKRIYLQHFR